MSINWLAILGAAFIPLIVGFAWYHKKVFGNAWLKAVGISPDATNNANMPLIFGLTFVVSFILSFGLQFVVIHQMHIPSIFLGMPDEATLISDFMSKYGSNYRTFGHGVFHGIEGAFLLILPTFTINALFERKGFKYIAINVGFWFVCFALMGGVLCQWA